MTSNTKAASFECPDGFTKEEVKSQLYYEDLDEDSELWLVRMPDDIDPSLIENKDIKLDTPSHVLSVPTGDDSSKFFEFMTEKRELSNLCLVLPHKESKLLSGVKRPFKGNILITDYHVLQDTDAVVKLEPEENVLEHLNSNGNDDFPKQKPRGPKKSSKQDSFCSEGDTNSFADSQENEPGSSHKKHKSKSRKKKSRSTDEMKMELSSDVDEFPSCVSQK